MAHYAYINEENIVTQVIVGKDEADTTHNWEEYYGNFKGMLCKRTSYNTRGGEHIYGGTPFRKNYAGIGFTWDENRDAFIPPQPFPSWILNEKTCLWDSPIPYPEDGNHYTWNEEEQKWILLETE